MSKKKYPEPFLTKRTNYYYFFYTDKNGKRLLKSTGKPKGKKEDARRFIRNFIDKLNFTCNNNTFRDYTLPYFIWETCPRVKRLISEGKAIGRTHVLKSRAWLGTTTKPLKPWPNTSLASLLKSLQIMRLSSCPKRPMS